MAHTELPAGPKYLAVGGILVAVTLFFGVLNGIPWASKEEVREFKTEVRQDIKDIKMELQALNRALMRSQLLYRPRPEARPE